jgi:hypothetical protein
MICAVSFPMQLFEHIVGEVRFCWVKALTIAKLAERSRTIKRHVSPFLP